MTNQHRLGAVSIFAAALYSITAAAADYSTQIYSVAVDPVNGVLHIDGVDLAPAGAPGNAHVQMLGQALTIHEANSSGTHIEAALPANMDLYPGTGYQLFVSPSRTRAASGASSSDQAFFTLYVASKLSGALEVDGAKSTDGSGNGGAAATASGSGSNTKNSTSITNWLGTMLARGKVSPSAAANSPVITPSDGSTFTLPYTGSAASSGSLFALTNTSTGDALDGTNSSTAANAVAVQGLMSSTSASGTSAGVRGVNNATSGLGSGIWGSTAGLGAGVYGTTGKGSGVRGYATSNGTGVLAYSSLGKALSATSNTGTSGIFIISNTGSTADDVAVTNAGKGRSLAITSTNSANTTNALNVTANGPGVIFDHSQGNAGNFFMNNTQGVGAGVRGEVNSVFGNNGTAGVYGTASGTGGYGGYFEHNETTGFGIALQAISYGKGAVLVVDAEGTNTDLAQFQSGGNNKARIDANGTGFFDGGTQNSGADLAEFVPVSGSVPQVGDVVEIDPHHPNSFRLCAEANTTRVAGIISTAPGVTLNAKDSATEEVSGPALALAGRVPTKVNNRGGAIHIGDLLVASSEPGRAMRAPRHPRPGTVIGKALQDSVAEEGSVEVLVMLR